MTECILATYPGFAKSVGTILTSHAPTWVSAACKYLSQHVGPSALPVMLRRKGFRTGLFSASLDLDWDWTRWVVEDSLGFDTVSNCNRSMAESRKLNSWACEEELAWEAMLQFMSRSNQDEVPFLAVIFTTAQHNPYSVSKGFRESNRNNDYRREAVNVKHQDYLRALQYTDDNLGRTMDSMDTINGLADRSLFAVVGDHGESFGQRHIGNMLHRNHLYEENVRVFFLLAQPCFHKPSKKLMVEDHRPASNIDVGLTILGASNASDSEPSSFVDDLSLQPGRNLLQRVSNDTGNVVFFLKRSNRGMLGLIDGRWKFMMPMGSFGQQESHRRKYNLPCTSRRDSSGNISSCLGRTRYHRLDG